MERNHVGEVESAKMDVIEAIPPFDVIVVSHVAESVPAGRSLSALRRCDA